MKNRELMTFVSFISFLLVLILLPLTTGCAQPAPVPTPTPAPTPAPHPIVNFELIGGPTGATETVNALGMSELINKNHPWLKAKFAEGPGSLAIVQAIVADQNIRGKTISYTVDGTWDLATKGKKPFAEPYKNIKALFRSLSGVMTLVSLDPKIQTLDDIKGKRVSLGQAGISQAILYRAILETAGLWDKVKIEYPGWKEQANLLVDGVIEVAIVVNPTTPTGVIPAAPLADVLPLKKVYFVDVPADIINKAREKGDLPLYPGVVKANGYSPGVPEKDSTGYLAYNIWFADASLSDETAYEFVKLVYERCEELVKYHAQLKQVNKQDMPKLPFPESDWHPGALKFYKEKGIKLGL